MASSSSKQEAEDARPPPDGSDFDKLLLDGFHRVLGSGSMRSDPSLIQRRALEGKLGITVQFSSEHFGKKRRPAGFGERVVAPAAPPEAFNFTKVAAEEHIADVS